MEEKLAMAYVDTEDNVYISVKDVIEIERLPLVISEFISRFVKSMKIGDNGLPVSGFIGKSGVKVTGIFKYGEIVFISYVGSKEDLESEELVHIFSNISEEDYEQIKAVADAELQKLEEGTEEDGEELRDS